MKRQRILVTGGAGFIGSHIADRFLAGGWNVRVLDSLEPQVHGLGRERPNYLDDRVELLRGDICDRKAVIDALVDVDVLSHHAALVGVGQSLYEIERYARTNAYGASVILDVIANEKHTVRKMMVASSISIYGEGAYRCPNRCTSPADLRPVSRLRSRQWEVPCPDCGTDLAPIPTTEQKVLQPSSVYAIQKRDHEELFRVVGRAYGIPTVALRYFNVYGTRQALSNPYTGLVAIFASRLLNKKPPLIFEDGRQRRDLVSVRDIADANWVAVNHPSAEGQILNVGSGKSYTVLEIASILADRMGVRIAPEVTGDYREGDIRHCFADITAIRERFGWEPRYSLTEEVGELVAWVKSQHAHDNVDVARGELVSRGLAR